MRNEQNQTLAGLMNEIPGVELKKRHGRKFFFYIRLGEQMKGAPLEELDLSVRSYNSLKRAGYNHIGEVAEAISGGMELKQIRNCGAKSIREIMEHIFLYYYQSLPPERQEKYLTEIVVMNCEKRYGREE